MAELNLKSIPELRELCTKLESLLET
jgi:hypothetical protein